MQSDHDDWIQRAPLPEMSDDRVAELEALLDRVAHILGDDLEENSKDDARNYERVEDRSR